MFVDVMAASDSLAETQIQQKGAQVFERDIRIARTAEYLIDDLFNPGHERKLARSDAGPASNS